MLAELVKRLDSVTVISVAERGVVLRCAVCSPLMRAKCQMSWGDSVDSNFYNYFRFFKHLANEKVQIKKRKKYVTLFYTAP